jgi:hypothetical protein
MTAVRTIRSRPPTFSIQFLGSPVMSVPSAELAAERHADRDAGGFSHTELVGAEGTRPG